ncbi:MAG: helix-turn-helix domain-containing protein [Treponema sp.]|nr:helix-turn-helix domain-containing protein [Treponema sp.]
MFIYKIDVLEELKKAGYNTTRLRREKLLTESAIQDLRNGKIVGIISLEKICALLEIQPGDIIGYKRG